MPENVLSLSCGHCGAPLTVPGETRYVTCSYCNSRLEVLSSGSAVYTRVLEKLEQQTAQLASQVEGLTLQHELERLDREWAAAYGGQEIPSAAGTAVQAIFIIIWCCAAFGMAIGVATCTPIPWAGLVPFAMGVIGAVAFSRELLRKQGVKAAWEQYCLQRGELLRKITEHRAKAAPEKPAGEAAKTGL